MDESKVHRMSTKKPSMSREDTEDLMGEKSKTNLTPTVTPTVIENSDDDDEV